MPWVTLYTEEGIKVVTDEYGRYHIPGVAPGRHLVKIDGHTLPEGTKFITEETYLVKITPGLMGKASFAVLLPPSGIPEAFRKDLMVMVTQGVDISRPDLDIMMEPELLKLGVGVLEKDALFRLDTNYARFVKKWAIEVRDEMGVPVWTGYGIGAPPAEVTWDGKAENGFMIKPGVYSYQLKVRDAKHHEDWTTLKFFEVYNKLDPRAQKNYQPELPAVGDFNPLGRQAQRPLIAKRRSGQGKTRPEYGHDQRPPVTVDPETGMFQKEFFVEPGEHEFNIMAADPKGESTTYQKDQGQGQHVLHGRPWRGAVRINFANGAMEAADSDANRDGFTEDGRAAFFLKSKLKGSSSSSSLRHLGSPFRAVHEPRP